MNIVFTYVVDHGLNAPKITLKDKINGGNILAVAIDDRLKKLEEAEEFLKSLAESTEDAATQFAIEDYLKSH